jgi:hypothetical protein
MSTVRDHLLRRSRQAWLYRGAFFAVFVLLMVWMKRLGMEQLVAVPVLLLLVVIFMPLGAYFARCPSCRFPLEFMGRVRLRYGAKKYRTNFCPHCGLNLDSEHVIASAASPGLSGERQSGEEQVETLRNAGSNEA